jgi:1,4-dihydroxy-6-naphthoate synthase
MKKESANNSKTIVRVAHSPDADDRFMFWPIWSGKLQHPSFEFEFFEADTQKLNHLASTGLPDVCAISAIHYARVCGQYQPLLMGASVGNNYGPVLVSNKTYPKIGGLLISPGLQTTAHTVLQIIGKLRGFQFEETEEVSISPITLVFDTLKKRLLQKPALSSETPTASALLIHEGRLTYQAEKFVKLLDLGEAWQEEFKSSLPLGINVIARRISAAHRREISQFLITSCVFAQNHKQEFLDEFAIDGKFFSPSKTSAHLNMQALKNYLNLYANETTISISQSDAKSFETLLNHAWKFNLLQGTQPAQQAVDWV